VYYIKWFEEAGFYKLEAEDTGEACVKREPRFLPDHGTSNMKNIIYRSKT
jgi:hypothetical protein